MAALKSSPALTKPPRRLRLGRAFVARSCAVAARSSLALMAVLVFLLTPVTIPTGVDRSDSSAFASESFSHHLNNNVLRFGGTNVDCRAPCTDDQFSNVQSINTGGRLLQPFYRASDGKWYKLTYSRNPLDIAVEADGVVSVNPTQNSQTITADPFTTADSSGSVRGGYGKVIARGAIRGTVASGLVLTNTYELGNSQDFIKVTTRLENTSNSPSSNAKLWIGTSDDWIGTSDSSLKEKGNLVSGAFVAITDEATPASALRITSGDHGVLFYSTTPGTNTIINGYGDFQTRIVNRVPSASPKSANNDGSYGIYLPLGDLSAGTAKDIVWFYAAGSSSRLDTIAASVEAAAAPAVPTATPLDSSAGLTWLAPSSNDPITGYRIEVTKDGVVQSPTIDLASTALSSTVTGLVNGSSYTFKVAALTGDNRDTVGTLSGASLAVIPGAPSAPTISAVTAGNQKLTVAFTAPAATGGFPITAYEYSTDNGSTWTTASGTASPIVITGLTNGTPYQVKLRGKNASHSGVASSATDGTPASSVPDAPTINSVSTASQTLTVSFTPPADNGGASILRYEYSTDNGATWRRLSPDITTSPFVIENLSTDGTTRLVNGVAYLVSIRAVNGTGNSAGATAVTATPAIPVVSSPSSGGPVVPPVVVVPPRVLPRVLPTPPPVVGPVVSATPSAPPSAPTALIGGRPSVVSTQVTDPNNISLRAGVLNIGMNVPSDQGSVRQQGGSTEIQVRNGGVASVSGSGVLPRSTVQVFMPLGGSNSREIARIPVDANGSFSGDALFGSTPTEAPLPIGRHVLQMVTVDENRQQTVVELTVNIAQPPPAPELNRSTNERPTLLPGQSIATNGGQPEPVTVTPIADQKQATIEGDGWSMAVGLEGDGGGVASGEGGAVVTFVRDQGAVVSGTGFMPGTRADVWLFSDPTLLGTVEIDENGEFNGVVNIDGNVVTVGEHTLQLQGVGEDGFVRAANLGVSVMDEAPALTAESSVSFFWLWLVLIALVVALLVIALWRYRRSRV